MSSKTRADLLKRLTPYWQMEAGNIVLIPAIMFWTSGGALSWIALVPMLAMVTLLMIGAVYWRAKVRQLRGEAFDFAATLRRIKALRQPSLLLTLAGCAAALAGWVRPDWSAGLADRLVASVAALLAGLEYVNYYYRQLQHFDNGADFRRLLAGKGFRRSWLARDLDQI